MSDLEKLNRDFILALNDQEVLKNIPGISSFICDRCEVKIFQPGESLTEQGAEESGIYFILSGEVKVFVNGAHVRNRYAGMQVGEIATIRPFGKRTATVIAAKETRTLFIDREAFLDTKSNFTGLTEALAIQAMSRLDQRSETIIPPNAKPRVFIASSKENLAIAELISSKFPVDKYQVRVWTGIFRPTHGVLEDLENEKKNCDFGIMVWGAEDELKIRGKVSKAPRANVVFETGLFMGELGRSRIFIVTPSEFPEIPSDFGGVTLLPCDYDEIKMKNIAPGFVEDVVLKEIAEQGARTGRTRIA